MEWIIAILVILLILSKLKNNKTVAEGTNGEEALKRAISVAYNSNEEYVPTKIPWWEAEKFAQDRGAEIRHIDNAIYANVQMMVSNEKVLVVLGKDQNNSTTAVSVIKYSSLD